MRIVVAGGTGFIGGALVGALVERGYEVAVLTRSVRGRTAPPGVSFHAWDGKTADGWGALADGAKAVVNLAGENIAKGRWTPEVKRRIRDSRLDSCRAVLEAVRNAGTKPEVLAQASAVGFYGDRGDERVDESFGPGNGFLAETAVAWEAASEPVEALGVRRVLLRTGVVLGNGGALAKMLPSFRMFLGGPLGDGRQYFPWIHLADEVGAAAFLIDAPEAAGPYNLAAPESVDMAAFSRALGRALGRPSAMRVPAAVLKAVFGEMAEETMLAGCRAVPDKLIKSGYSFAFPSLASALGDLTG